MVIKHDLTILFISFTFREVNNANFLHLYGKSVSIVRNQKIV